MREKGQSGGEEAKCENRTMQRRVRLGGVRGGGGNTGGVEMKGEAHVEEKNAANSYNRGWG